MHFALCKEQHHSQEQDLFVFMVKLKLLRDLKPADLTVCIFSLSFCSFPLLIWDFLLSFCTYESIVPYWSSAQMSCREEVGASFVALGILEQQTARRNLAPLDKQCRKIIPMECLFENSAPVHLGTPSRSRIVDRTSQSFSWPRVNGIRATWPVHRRSRRVQ
jgi:hypothetical protein